MSSDRDTEIHIKIQDALVNINNVTSKIKKELDLIEELMKEDGQLRTTVGTANKKLSSKIDEMGLNVAEIISESKSGVRLEPDLLDSITSAAITEKLLSHLDG